MDINADEIISSGLAGFIGTLAFAGFFLAVGNTGVIKGAIPALYGFSPSLGIGLTIHLIHGAILGILYAVVISATDYGHHLEDVKRATLWGLGYGLLTTVILAAILMPIWLNSVGFAKAPSAPNFNPLGLVGHLIYGGVLGATYPLIRDKLE